MSVELLARLQAGSLTLAPHHRETIRIGPFTAFVDHQRSLKFFSFAIPDRDAGAEAAGALPALVDAFAQRGRNARIELVEELNPALPAAIETAGWKLSERVPVMACTADSLVVPSVPEGVGVIVPQSDAPDDVVASWQRTQAVAFEDEKPMEDAHVAMWRERAPRSFYAGAVSGGEVVGTAEGSPIAVGCSEIGGVATLPGHRRRGIAGLLTAHATAAAFAAGAEIVWLTAYPEAQGIYARAGFSVVGTAANFDACESPRAGIRPAP